MTYTFVLVPFFLIGSFSVEDEIRFHQPEYTFIANINSSLRVEGFDEFDDADGKTYQTFHTHSILKCRSQKHDTLNCRVSELKTVMYNVLLNGSQRFFVRENNYNWLHYKDKPFQLKFDHRGIQEVRINQKMSEWYLNMIRGMVNQLNLGMDFHKKDDKFNDMEKSYFGECEAAVNISREVRSTEVPREELLNFKIIPVSAFVKDSDEIVTIEKNRNLENCKHKRDYMLLGEEDDFNVKIISSKSRIVVSDRSYYSCTANNFRLLYAGNNASLEEEITMKLTSMKLAFIEKIPFLDSNPDTTSLCVFSNVTRESDKKTN